MTFNNPFSELTVKKALPNLHAFGADAIEFGTLKKNLPHFEEVALQFGLNNIKGQILKRTLGIVNSRSNGTTIDGMSFLGLPVYSPLFISAGSYTDNDGKPKGAFSDIRIDACIMEVSFPRNVIITDIQGRDGSIIQYLSAKSKKFNIKGKIFKTDGNGHIVDARNTYPYAEVSQLMTALQSNVSLHTTSWFLNMAGIYDFVVTGEPSFKQEEGALEYQMFEFDAISDTPVILNLK